MLGAALLAALPSWRCGRSPAGCAEQAQANQPAVL